MEIRKMHPLRRKVSRNCDGGCVPTYRQAPKYWLFDRANGKRKRRYPLPLTPASQYSITLVPLRCLSSLRYDLIFSQRIMVARSVEVDDVAFARILKNWTIPR